MESIQDEELSKFYYDLMVSEAGHYRNFIDLAKVYIEEATVERRWQAYLKKEANIIHNLEVRADRMH